MKLHIDNFKIAGEVAKLTFTKKRKKGNNSTKDRFSLVSVTLEKNTRISSARNEYTRKECASASNIDLGQPKSVAPGPGCSEPDQTSRG